MKLPSLWSGRQDLFSDPFRAIRREMRELDDMFRGSERRLPSVSVGMNVPAINVAESKDALEVTVDLPGIEEKDINVSLEGNQLSISGERKEESKRDEKDWHIEERSYGSFYRSLTLPFEPEDGAVEAHWDKGVLHLNVKKPAEAKQATKTIEIKKGAPPASAS